MVMVGEAAVSRGVVERRFDIAGETENVPGIVWTPEDAQGERPLVLLGHGGTQHKRAPYILGLARRLVRHHGFAAAAIDAPGHGERIAKTVGKAPTDGGGEVILEWLSSSMGPDAIDRMCADWHAALKEIRDLPEVGHGPLAYWGLSLGTLLGVPFVASAPDVRVAVLGLMGSFGSVRRRIRADAATIGCPVLFALQADDELVAFDRGIELFLDLGTKDKRLHAHPGRHSAVPAEEAMAMEDFLARHLVTR
jgi:alpha-beta hydrolase superfamily lysophospholipase